MQSILNPADYTLNAKKKDAGLDLILKSLNVRFKAFRLVQRLRVVIVFSEPAAESRKLSPWKRKKRLPLNRWLWSMASAHLVHPAVISIVYSEFLDDSSRNP